jgi:hypothetical protein
LYYPATSSREDIHRRIGGRCTTDNTKVIFKVFGGDESHRTTATPAKNEKPPPAPDSDGREEPPESANGESDESNKINYNHDFGHGFHPTQRPFFVNSNSNVNSDNFSNNSNKPTKKTSEYYFEFLKTVRNLKSQKIGEF